MSDLNISRATTTTMNTSVSNYSVASKIIDAPSKNEETTWQNQYWSKYLGYYKTIPEFKEAIRALARWSVGRGLVCDGRTKIILDLIKGAGEDTFQSIMTNHIIVKKVNGDAYCEIIREPKSDILINLKPLNPATMRTVFNKKGMIVRYEEFDPSSDSKEAIRKFEPKDIFHSMNDRIANEIHGTSVLEACQWVIDARNEAMADWRRISHRSSLRVIYIDIDNSSKLSELRAQYHEGINKGEVLILPGKKGEDVEIIDYTIPPIASYLEWISYLEGFFYQAVGVPKAIANTSDFSEASSKVGYLTFEPVYVEEQTLLEQDIRVQLGLEVKFNRPASLSGVMQEDEAKNTGQMGFQPSDTIATAGRVE